MDDIKEAALHRIVVAHRRYAEALISEDQTLAVLAAEVLAAKDIVNGGEIAKACGVANRQVVQDWLRKAKRRANR